MEDELEAAIFVAVGPQLVVGLSSACCRGVDLTVGFCAREIGSRWECGALAVSSGEHWSQDGAESSPFMCAWSRVFPFYVRSTMGDHQAYRVEWLIMLCTISISVRFLLSATPFCGGSPGVEYCAAIPFSCRNLAKGPCTCPHGVCLAIILSTSV